MNQTINNTGDLKSKHLTNGITIAKYVTNRYNNEIFFEFVYYYVAKCQEKLFTFY